MILTLIKHDIYCYHIYLKLLEGDIIEETSRRHVNGNYLSHQQSCLLICESYVRNSKIRRGTMGICHPRKFNNHNHVIWCIYLVFTYIKSIRQQRPGRTRIEKELCLTCMIIINIAMGWFETVQVP